MTYGFAFPPPFSPPNDDSNWSPLGSNPELIAYYKDGSKQHSKAYRELIDSFLLELNAGGNMQFFALTINAHEYDDGIVGPSSLSLLPNDYHADSHRSVFSITVRQLIKYLAEIDLLEVIYLSQEFHKEGKLAGLPHYHLFLGIRALFGTSYINLQAALQSHLTSGPLGTTFVDFQLRRLHDFMDQKKFLNYLIKEEKRHYQALYTFSSIFDSNPRNYWYRFSVATNDISLPLAALDSYLDLPTKLTRVPGVTTPQGYPMWTPPLHLLADLQSQQMHLRHRYINPVPGERITANTLIHCLNLFCQFRGLFLSRGNIYRKRRGTRFSYELVYSLQDLLRDLTPLFAFLSEEFPFQSRVMLPHFQEAAIRCIPDVIRRFRDDDSMLLHRIELNYHLIEFRNGIYNKRIDQFLRYDHYEPDAFDNVPFNCYLYFDRYHEGHTRMLPRRWLAALRQQFDSEELLQEFCCYFAVLFHGDSIQQKFFEMPKKDRAIYVEGVSNSGKTRLLAEVVRAIVGPENVGMLGSSQNFPLETVGQNSQALILDEFRYQPSQRDLLLRLFDGTPLPLDQKHKAQRIVSIVEPVLILANMDQNQAMLNDYAFQNRFHYYKFNVVVSDGDGDLLDQIYEELSSILLYCNRLFVKRYGKKLIGKFKLRSKPNSRSRPLMERLAHRGFFLPPSSPNAPKVDDDKKDPPPL